MLACAETQSKATAALHHHLFLDLRPFLACHDIKVEDWSAVPTSSDPNFLGGPTPAGSAVGEASTRKPSPAASSFQATMCPVFRPFQIMHQHSDSRTLLRILCNAERPAITQRKRGALLGRGLIPNAGPLSRRQSIEETNKLCAWPPAAAQLRDLEEALRKFVGQAGATWHRSLGPTPRIEHIRLFACGSCGRDQQITSRTASTNSVHSRMLMRAFVAEIRPGQYPPQVTGQQ